MCSGMTSSLFLRYMFFLGTITIFTTCILIADGMLKTASEQAKAKDPSSVPVVEDEIPSPKTQPIYADQGFFNNHDTHDYSKDFTFESSVLWIDLLYLEGLIIVLMSWCFYFQIKRALATRKNLLYVEARDRTANISRV